MIKVKLPAFSPAMDEAVLATWHVAVGDRVSVGDVVADIELEKATTEFEISFEGIIDALLVNEGDAVRVGMPILQLRKPL